MMTGKPKKLNQTYIPSFIEFDQKFIILGGNRKEINCENNSKWVSL